MGTMKTIMIVIMIMMTITVIMVTVIMMMMIIKILRVIKIILMKITSIMMTLKPTMPEMMIMTALRQKQIDDSIQTNNKQLIIYRVERKVTFRSPAEHTVSAGSKRFIFSRHKELTENSTLRKHVCYSIVPKTDEFSLVDTGKIVLFNCWMLFSVSVLRYLIICYSVLRYLMFFIQCYDI